MAMTRRDYHLVAKALAERRRVCREEAKLKAEAIDEAIETVAAFFALHNDNFKRDVFLEVAFGKDSDT